MVWCREEMLDAVALQEVRELFTGELRSVVTHELLRNSMMCEQRTKMLNSLLSGGRIHLQDFGPLAVGVNDDEPHVRQEGSREVDVDPLSQPSTPVTPDTAEHSPEESIELQGEQELCSESAVEDLECVTERRYPLRDRKPVV